MARNEPKANSNIELRESVARATSYKLAGAGELRESVARDTSYKLAGAENNILLNTNENKN